MSVLVVWSNEIASKTGRIVQPLHGPSDWMRMNDRPERDFGNLGIGDPLRIDGRDLLNCSTSLTIDGQG